VSFKVEVLADTASTWHSNMLRFGSEAEARAYAHDLASRWVLVNRSRVVESGDPVNARWSDGHLEQL
jgi:hypothetical protein